MRPKKKNGERHPYRSIITTTRAGVKAAPTRDAACVSPCAKPRSVGSIQRESERVAIGKAPASPMPKKNRHSPMESAFQENAVSEVKIDHHTTTRESAR